MKLSEFLQNIALGELEGSKLVELGGFEIQPKFYPKVINALNQALDYFYSIFPLKENQLILRLQPNISRYYLDRDYADTNYDSNLKYIADTPDNPYENDVLQIQAVFTEDGSSLSVNDPLTYYGVSTPEYNCIQVPELTLQRYKYLTVLYRAKHKRIPLNANPNQVEVSIPSSFEGALQTYVASLIYMFTHGDDNKQLSNSLFGKFKTQVEELKMEGIGYKPMAGINIKPLSGGWL